MSACRHEWHLVTTRFTTRTYVSQCLHCGVLAEWSTLPYAPPVPKQKHTKRPREDARQRRLAA